MEEGAAHRVYRRRDPSFTLAQLGHYVDAIRSVVLRRLDDWTAGAAGPVGRVLILDDYHLLQGQPVHEAMGFLFDHLLAQVHRVIATREDPPLPLARMRARRQINELRAADLRFTPDEACMVRNPHPFAC